MLLRMPSFCVLFVFFKGSVDLRDLHVLTHSFPTRRSADLQGESCGGVQGERAHRRRETAGADQPASRRQAGRARHALLTGFARPFSHRSEEHTSELQSLMRISYAVFCLKKKKKNIHIKHKQQSSTR